MFWILWEYGFNRVPEHFLSSKYKTVIAGEDNLVSVSEHINVMIFKILNFF